MKKLGTLFSLLFLMAGLSACSSKSDSRVGTQFDERAEYVQTADKRLNELEKKVSKLDNSASKMTLEASVRDLRAEYDGLRAAPSDAWFSYRTRLDSGINRVETQLRRAE